MKPPIIFALALLASAGLVACRHETSTAKIAILRNENESLRYALTVTPPTTEKRHVTVKFSRRQVAIALLETKKAPDQVELIQRLFPESASTILEEDKEYLEEKSQLELGITNRTSKPYRADAICLLSLMLVPDAPGIKDSHDAFAYFLLHYLGVPYKGFPDFDYYEQAVVKFRELLADPKQSAYFDSNIKVDAEVELPNPKEEAARNTIKTKIDRNRYEITRLAEEVASNTNTHAGPGHFWKDMDETLDALFVRWWFGGVFLPVIVTLVIGGAISIYSAVIVSRYFLFYQNREAGAIAVYNVHAKIRDISRSTDVPFEVGFLFNSPRFSLEEAGHRMASSVVIGVFNEIYYKLFEAAKYDLKAISQSDYNQGKFPLFPQLSEKDMPSFREGFLAHFSDATMNRLVDEILAAKPDWFAIFGARSIGRAWEKAFPRQAIIGGGEPVRDPAARAKISRRKG